MFKCFVSSPPALVFQNLVSGTYKNPGYFPFLEIVKEALFIANSSKFSAESLIESVEHTRRDHDSSNGILSIW